MQISHYRYGDALSGEFVCVVLAGIDFVAISDPHEAKAFSTL